MFERERTQPSTSATARQRDVAGIAAAAAGLALAAWGLWRIASIPYGPDEFAYTNPPGGSALWPVPFAPANGFTVQQWTSHVMRLVWLFPACTLLGFSLRHLRLRRPAALTTPIIVCLGTLITAVLALLVLRGVPLQDDEATYLMQADLLARGLVADPAYPMAAAFAEPFTIFTRAGLSGMYLFGEPMILALGTLLGFPGIGQWALVALTLWCAYRAAVRAGDCSVAWLGTLLLALSPMLTFTSAGFLSQVPALAGVAVAVWGVGVGGWRGGIVAGTGLGLAFAARPQSAVPVGLLLLAVYGWNDRRLVAGAVLAALPWAVAVGCYNLAVVGTPWLLPRSAYAGEMESYGFGQVLRNYEHTPVKALALTGVTLIRLNGWALGWPLSLAGPAVWLATGRPVRAIVGPWAVVALATFIFQAGYALVGISETGPIYHHAALPFVCFSTAAALHKIASRPWGGWVRATAVMSLMIGTTSFYAEHGLRLSRLSAAIEGPRRHLRLDPPALLFEDVWGARPQAGWVFGLPFRERSPTAPIVRFPRPTSAAQLSFLLDRWQDRRCSYLHYDWTARRYELVTCAEMTLRR